MAMGRPTLYRKEFHPKDYIEQSKQGKCKVQIASTWDVNVDTLYEWKNRHKEFSDAIKIGEQHCEAWYINTGQQAMHRDPKSFNLGVFVWMTKNILKWSDKVENKIEHSGEVKSGINREQSLKRMFKDEKSRALALELSEHLCEQEDLAEKEKGKKNGQD